MWTRCVVLLAVITLAPRSSYSETTGILAPTGPSVDTCGECCTIDFDNCPVNGEPKDKWVVCYYANWARNRQGTPHFTAQDIDPSLCTHINYAFTVLDSDTLTITEYLDSWTVEDERKNFEAISAFRSKGLTVMMSIGGCYDSVKEGKWSRMIGSDSARDKFVKSVVVFLEKYKFDGLDVYFSANKPADKDKFTQLMTELKTAFKGKFLLSAHVSSYIPKIEKSYDMASVCQVADWINVASYDDQFSPATEGTTAGQAPICKGSGGTGLSLKYYLDVLHCPPEKITVGVALYANTYTLKAPSRPGFGVQTTGPGTAGPYLKMAGYLTYYAVCSFAKKEGWTKGVDRINGKFIYKGDQFASTPSVRELSRKSCLINYLNLRGINLWTIDYDDFRNVCECGTYPLLKTLNKHLRGLKTDVQCF